VGESGAGKSLTGQAIIGLLDPPGRIAQGQISLNGERIDDLAYHQLRRIRGKKIDMIFQDPLTSLNPLYTIGKQLLATIPDVEMTGRKRGPVAGEIPNPIDPPAGCAFHPRCPAATEHCHKVIPELVTLDSGVQMACHQVATAPDEPTDSCLS
jgi:oligopeptide/dipeptide ABC transporter ATP-binding protein